MWNKDIKIKKDTESLVYIHPSSNGYYMSYLIEVEKIPCVVITILSTLSKNKKIDINSLASNGTHEAVDSNRLEIIVRKDPMAVDRVNNPASDRVEFIRLNLADYFKSMKGLDLIYSSSLASIYSKPLKPMDEDDGEKVLDSLSSKIIEAIEQLLEEAKRVQNSAR